MAWLATDKIGRETISPGRAEFDGSEWYYEEETYIEGEYGNIGYSIDLPDGTIEKILGRKLTYEESPVEIK